MLNHHSFSGLAERLLELIHSPGTALGDRHFAKLAVDLFALQFEHVAPYRRFCQARGVAPARISDWREIPALPTDAFKEFDISSLPACERTCAFLSSGTTGQTPSRHFHNEQSLRLYRASLIRWFAAQFEFRAQDSSVPIPLRETQALPAPLATYPRPERLIVLTPPHRQCPSSSLIYMFDAISQDMHFSKAAFFGVIDDVHGSWTVQFERLGRALDESLAESCPVFFLGTAFSFVHLLDWLRAAERKCQLPPGSRVLETGGYKGRSRSLAKSELHALLIEYLGIPASHILCEYGMSELSSQAYQGNSPSPVHPRDSGFDLRAFDIQGNSQSPSHSRSSDFDPRAFHFPPWARVQIVSPETGQEVAEGETGLIRVLDLANLYSVASIQTQDLGIRRGSGFDLIGRAVLAEPRGCSLMAS